MRFKKVYGQSRIDKCPFCGRQAVTENPEGVPVCIAHKEKSMPAMKCICGDYLDVKKGKFGAYFSCLRCGNISYRKAMEANPNFGKDEVKEEKKEEKPAKEKKEPAPAEKKEIFITSDDVDIFYS